MYIIYNDCYLNVDPSEYTASTGIIVNIFLVFHNSNNFLLISDVLHRIRKYVSKTISIRRYFTESHKAPHTCRIHVALADTMFEMFTNILTPCHLISHLAQQTKRQYLKLIIMYYSSV